MFSLHKRLKFLIPTLILSVVIAVASLFTIKNITSPKLSSALEETETNENLEESEVLETPAETEIFEEPEESKESEEPEENLDSENPEAPEEPEVASLEIVDTNHHGGGLDHSLDYLTQENWPRATSALPMFRGGTSLPAKYNSREETFGKSVKVKNQNSEGLCWAYAGTTALEFYLAKNNLTSSINGTVSPKHIDYQMVPANLAYKNADVAAGKTNAFYDRYMAALSGRATDRTLGDGGTSLHVITAFSNPLVAVSEADFTSELKKNDARLAGISTYEDIWTLPNVDSILTPDSVDPEYKTYTVKQDYSAVNNLSSAKFAVTMKRINYSNHYGDNADKTNLVQEIKRIIKTYGAAEVMTYYDMENCGNQMLIGNADLTAPYFDEDGIGRAEAVVIDRTASICNNNTGHAMTIVGWDDSYEYNDNGTERTGAFIIQNSWGAEPMDVYYQSNPIKVYYSFYMGYVSAFDILYFDSAEPLSSYDHIYSVEDYKSSTISPSSNELIFEFTSNEKETLKEITFNENVSDYAYDIYVSSTGKASNFIKQGTLAATLGVNKFEFANPVVLNGNFAIKLVRAGNYGVYNDERLLDLLSVYTVKNQIPSPEEPETPEAPEDGKTGEVTWLSNKTYTRGESTDLSFKIDYPLDLFASLEIDSKLVPESQYTLKSGSTIITIKSDYLNNLSTGVHIITVNYKDNSSINTSFTLAAQVEDEELDNESVPAVPNTGGFLIDQNGKITPTGYGVSILIVGIIIFYHKKRRSKLSGTFEIIHEQ